MSARTAAGLVVVLGVLALAAVLMTRHTEPGPSQVTEQDFAQITDLLTTDPPVAVSLISRGQFVRTFGGVNDERLTGTVARMEPDGSCWGIEVQIPKQWIADGVGTIDVSGLHLLDERRCR